MINQNKISQKKNPRESANIISICFFWWEFKGCKLFISKIGFRWMNKLLGEGYKKELGIEDLYEVRQEDRSSVVGDSLERFVFIFSVFQSVLKSSI